MDAISDLKALYGKPKATLSNSERKGWNAPTLPKNWRDRLPDPSVYYPAHVDRLGRTNGTGWAQGKCPFHEDSNASLSVHLADGGGWKCFAGCGGGDIVSFHSRLKGLGFKEAVSDLLRGGA